MSWIQELLGIGNKIMGHYTPEQIEKRLRQKRDKLDRKRRKLLRGAYTKSKADKIKNIEYMLADINSRLSS